MAFGSRGDIGDNVGSSATYSACGIHQISEQDYADQLDEASVYIY